MIANNVRHEQCPLCRSARISRVGDIAYERVVSFSSNKIELECIPELWRCGQCGSSFAQNIVPENTATALYSKGASSEKWPSVPFMQHKPKNQIRCLEQYFSEGKKVLDIGCNTGELLDYARSLGCTTAGVEYSRASRAILENKGHLALASLSEVTQKFDVITAFDLVEHLYDLPAFVLSCKNLLEKNGVLVILTGDIESFGATFCKSAWWYVRFPEHVVFPSRKYFVQYAGFVVEQWIHTYAAKDFQHGWPLRIRSLMSGVLRGSYNGLPPVAPDHVLAVLRDGA